MSISEKIHPEFVESKAKEIRDFGIRMTEAEPAEVEEMVNEFTRELQASKAAPEIAHYLYDNAPTQLETQPGHWYGVYVSSQERGTGSLFAIQKILTNPNNSPQPDPNEEPLHDHQMDETTLLVEGRIQSVLEIGGKRVVVETLPLVPNQISKGTPHGVINPGPIDSIGFCIRPQR